MPREMGNHGFVRSAAVVSGCTLLSRILGLARDMLCSHIFGARMVMDAFSLAFVIPNLFRRLFGEGALTAAFLPAFVDRYDTGRKAEAHALLNRIATVLALFLGLVVAAGIGVTYLLPQDEKALLFAKLLRIMLPYVVIICVAAMFGAALNGMRHYFAPAFAPVAMNVGLITALFVFPGDIRALAWAVLAGGVLEILVLLPPLLARGVPIRPRLDIGDPGLREVGRQFTPMVFGLALAQINEVTARVIAWRFVPEEGAVSALYYGNQLTQLPLSLIGTAVATAVFPLLASPKEDFRDVFRKALRLVLFVSAPATVGLVVLARPIVALLFEHGEFGAAETARAAGVVMFFAAGLWCYCANTIQVRAFYGKKDTRTPVRVAGAMVFLNLTLCLSLVGPLQERGIALANSATGLCSFFVLNALLRRRHDGLDFKALYGGVFRIALASAVMGAAVWGVWRLMLSWTDTTIGGKLLRVAIPVAVGVTLYVLLARLLRMEEARLLFRRGRSEKRK